MGWCWKIIRISIAKAVRLLKEGGGLPKLAVTIAALLGLEEATHEVCNRGDPVLVHIDTLELSDEMPPDALGWLSANGMVCVADSYGIANVARDTIVKAWPIPYGV